MKRFKDLKFKKHPAKMNRKTKKKLIKQNEQLWRGSDLFKKMNRAKITFENGYFLSVIYGVMFYSDGKTTYEAWCAEYEEYPRGYLTKQEVTDYMIEIQSLKPKEI